MTNLLNTLKTMENETTGVKNDVINFLLEYSDNSEDLQTHLEDINNYGCESGQVNHLIYTKDTVAYFEEHEHEINEFVSEVYGFDMVEGSDLINTLSEIFPLDDFEDRIDDDNIIDRAIYIVADNNDITEDELNESYDDYEEEIFEERYELATTLEGQDKNYLAWAIFEYNASVLFDELDEMELIK